MGFGPTTKQFDLLRQICGTILSQFNKKESVPGPCDGIVLKLYYKFTLWLIFGGYVAISYNWWHKDILTCASKFNADQQIRSDYINICASYLYVPDEDGVIQGRRYLLFYRWIHWILFLLAILFYIPHKLSKRAENPKLKELFNNMDSSKEDIAYNDACNYYFLNSGTHNILFIKYFLINAFCFILNIFSFSVIDFIFQGKFYDLGYATYPFNRNIKNFTDELSLRFPPFALCEITPFNVLTNKRTERYGCHLTYMELYEKYFIVLWVFMIGVSVLTIIYIAYLSLFLLPSLRTYLLTYSKPLDAKEKEIESINNNLRLISYGDFYLLYRMKSFFSHHKYYDFLNTLFDEYANQEFMSNQTITKSPPENTRNVRMRGHLHKNMTSASKHGKSSMYID